MKTIKFILSVLFAVCVFSSASAKDKLKPVYAFGVSISLIDSTVYYTNIQLLDSVYLDKNGFLPYRDTYSYQLKNYLEINKGLSNRTCMIFFDDNTKKINKELNKLIARYKKQNAMLIPIEKEEFMFTKPEE